MPDRPCIHKLQDIVLGQLPQSRRQHMHVQAEPGFRCRNEDSHGNENRKSRWGGGGGILWEKDSTSILLFYENIDDGSVNAN